jgi:hypothetical protein
MIIKYLDLEVKFVRRGKVQQSMKLNEWARNEFEKKRGAVNETNGIR